MMRRSFISPLLAAVVAVALAVPAGATRPATPVREGLGIARIIAPPSGSTVVETQLAEGGSAAAEGDERYPWIYERSATDRPDERTGRQIHVVYLIAAGMPDDRFDERGFLEDSARSMNHWTREETGNLQWRFDTYTFPWDDPATPEIDPVPVEGIDVTTIESTRSSSQLNSVDLVEAELISHGLNNPSKRYLSYVAANAGGVCGDAWYNFSPLPDNFDGQYSDIYLYSSSGCRARDFAQSATQPSFTETIAMQEMVHNDAMVPMVAPRNCIVSPLAFGHVCTGALWASPGLDPESTDVMFPYVGLPLNQKHLDTDHLDYFRHPFPYRDLEQSPYLETV